MAKKQVAEKLDELMVSFGGFEASMKEGTRQRREQDEQRLLDLKKDMGRLETEVESEKVKRAEVNKALQQWSDEQLESVRETLRARLEARTERVEASMKLLAERMSDFESHVDSEKLRITTEIRERNRALKRQLAEFIETFEAEKEDRLRREAAIVKRLADHEQEVAQRFDEERKTREDAYQGLRDRLGAATLARRKADERFQESVVEELATLTNDLARETETREAEDDEIVEAMNRYTRKLQGSLHIINSTET